MHQDLSESVTEGENPKTDIARYGKTGYSPGCKSGLDACASATTSPGDPGTTAFSSRGGQVPRKTEVSVDRPDPKEQTRGRGQQVSPRQLHTAGSWEHHLSGSTIKGGMATIPSITLIHYGLVT